METLTFYTVPEVATILRLRKGYVYDLINQGRLKVVRLSERRTRIRSDILNEFIEQEMANILSNNTINVQPPKRGRRRKHVS